MHFDAMYEWNNRSVVIQLRWLMCIELEVGLFYTRGSTRAYMKIFADENLFKLK